MQYQKPKIEKINREIFVQKIGDYVAHLSRFLGHYDISAGMTKAQYLAATGQADKLAEYLKKYPPETRPGH